MSTEEILKELNLKISDEEKDREYVSKLRKNIDKVKYLRLIKHYTQEEAANIIGISVRQLQRIDKELR